MTIFREKQYDAERALYALSDISLEDCRFDGKADGESALKECHNVTAARCFFNLRYPLWHVTSARLDECELTKNCRAALWYDTDITLSGCRIDGIKAIRECKGVRLDKCAVDSPEFMWKCRDIEISDTEVTSEYPFLECRDMQIERLTLKGKYSFQYAENVTLNNCVLDTKDAFWHSKNVTVTDSVVKGEYLGWYSENLTLVRCKIVGTQPLCCCRGLTIRECTMESADLAFEKSEVDAVVSGNIDSVKNPLSGRITADGIGGIILETAYCDPSKTVITTKQ